MKLLHVIESAYRSSAEEQDDTIIWLTRSMRTAGASVDVLLIGNAVSYAIEDQSYPALVIGEWRQRHPADISGQMRQLIDDGAHVWASLMDVNERGIPHERILRSIDLLLPDEIAEKIDGFDRVLAW